MWKKFAALSHTGKVPKTKSIFFFFSFEYCVVVLFLPCNRSVLCVSVVAVHSTSCDNPVRTNYLGHLQNPSLDHETNFVKHMLRILIIRPLFLISDF